MADTSPLAGLLGHVSHIFSVAGQLGRSFQQEHGACHKKPETLRRLQVDFNEYCDALLALRDPMQDPPKGFAPVGKALLRAAGVAKRIRDVMQTPDGRTWDSFLGYFPELNSVAADGLHAVKEVTKTGQLDDPFAFVDQPTIGQVSAPTGLEMKGDPLAEGSPLARFRDHIYRPSSCRWKKPHPWHPKRSRRARHRFKGPGHTDANRN
jgi:hypothetical protein